jgi:NAD(P)H dehydrogenase (quinone)
MKFAISGASGRLGRRTADLLLDRVPASDIVLISRDPSLLSDRVAGGAEVRAGDFDDPASLGRAFAGVDRLLLISTDAIGSRIVQHEAAVAAAVAAGVQSVVYTSMINPSDSNPAFVAAEHRATERTIKDSGLRWTMLRNAIYTEMLLPSAPAAIVSGTLLTNTGAGVNVNVARDDCAAVAATVLAEDGHDGKSYDITGSEPLDAEDLAALYAELSGEPIGVLQVDDAAWAAAMTEHGMPEGEAAVYVTFGASQRHGYAAVMTTAVEDITGRPPRSLREVLAPALRATPAAS